MTIFSTLTLTFASQLGMLTFVILTFIGFCYVVVKGTELALKVWK